MVSLACIVLQGALIRRLSHYLDVFDWDNWRNVRRTVRSWSCCWRADSSIRLATCAISSELPETAIGAPSSMMATVAVMEITTLLVRVIRKREQSVGHLVAFGCIHRCCSGISCMSNRHARPSTHPVVASIRGGIPCGACYGAAAWGRPAHPVWRLGVPQLGALVSRTVARCRACEWAGWPYRTTRKALQRGF